MNLSINSFIPYCLSRRNALAARIDEGIVVLPTAPEYIRNSHTHFPFRPDSDFFYLTAFDEPHAVAVLLVEGGEIKKSILFCLPRDPEKETWEGPRYGLDQSKTLFAFDETYPIGDFDRQFCTLMMGQHTLFYRFGIAGQWDQRLLNLVGYRKQSLKPEEMVPYRFEDLTDHLAALRLIKDDFEITLLKKAAHISAHAHRLAMMTARPGCYEYQIEGELIGAFRKGGGTAPAYPSIVASGPTCCVLHSIANNRQIEAGELVLIDAACEWMYYAADITRTWPITGTLSGPQKALYDIVLAAQLAAIDAVKPGNRADLAHQKAVEIMTQGLIDLKLLTSSLDEALEHHHYRRFFMHRTSHWIGLDVHDVGPSINSPTSLSLVPGQLLSIEPGIYCPNEEDIPAAYRNIGIRIEDEILVTETGSENLTHEVPKSPEEMKALIGQG